MSLFMLGDFVLSSGTRSNFKIDCDALTDEDIEALAAMIRQMVGPFGSVEGVPKGGLRLAAAMEPYVFVTPTFVPSPHLIVDDVLTAGGSMNRLRDVRGGSCTATGATIKGAVIFARGDCPVWVDALFQMPQCFWPAPKQRES